MFGFGCAAQPDSNRLTKTALLLAFVLMPTIVTSALQLDALRISTATERTHLSSKQILVPSLWRETPTGARPRLPLFLIESL